jgi:hypothetical protein
MDFLSNTIENSALASLSRKAPENVLKAIQKASAKTGVNFAYMVQQAAVESSFNPAAKAKTSSATGLYQFLSSTWMSMVDKYGDKHGIDTEGKTKTEILALRKDPEIASKMAAEFASENEKFLNTNWGGTVGPTELYLAHFMGAGGATGFLKAKDQNPLQPAADIMPEAARSNRNVFFDKSGRAKSIDEVYAFFDKKFSIKNDELPTLDSAPDQTLVAQSAEKIQAPHTDETSVISAIFTNNPPMPSNHSRFTTAHASFDNDHSVIAALPGQIPGAYQNLLRSPIDLMLMAQMDIKALFSDNNDKSLF